MALNSACCWCMFVKAEAPAVAPHAEQKPAPSVSHTYLLICKITGWRGDVVWLAGRESWRNMGYTASPAHTSGIQPGTSSFRRCFPQDHHIIRGISTSLGSSCHCYQHLSNSRLSTCHTAGTFACLLRACTQVVTVVGSTGTQN